PWRAPPPPAPTGPRCPVRSACGSCRTPPSTAGASRGTRRVASSAPRRRRPGQTPTQKRRSLSLRPGLRSAPARSRSRSLLVDDLGVLDHLVVGGLGTVAAAGRRRLRGGRLRVHGLGQLV